MVANEVFPEFFDLRRAEITIRVGGGRDLNCDKIADLWVKGAGQPVLLVGVRIVPGFGVNILSGPHMEQKLGLRLERWPDMAATNKRGTTVFHGPADGGGLYWARVPRSIGKCQKGIWGGERMMIRHIKPKNVTIKIGQDHLITGGHQRVLVLQ